MDSEGQKVVAYITNGRRLLVFRHTEFPALASEQDALLTTIDWDSLPD